MSFRSRGWLLATALAGCNTGPISDAPPSSVTSASSATTSPAPPSATPVASAGPHPLRVSAIAAREHVSLVDAPSATDAPSDLLPLVTVSRTSLWVADERIATVPAGSLGFEASIKRANNRAALQVTPLDDALQSLRHADPSLTTTRILLDRSTPYRTMLEVFFTSAHAGFTSFDFIVTSKATERALHITTPSRAEHDQARSGTAPPALTLVIEKDAFGLSVDSTPIGSGCTKAESGKAVPRDGKGDLDALVACVSRVRTMSPAWSGLVTIQLSAAPEVDAQSVLSVVAALLPTFPQIYFGLLR